MVKEAEAGDFALLFTTSAADGRIAEEAFIDEGSDTPPEGDRHERHVTSEEGEEGEEERPKEEEMRCSFGPKSDHKF